MEMIPLQTVLELVSDEIWRNQVPSQSSETGTEIPSLRERQQIVESLLPKASFDEIGMAICFDTEDSSLTEIPFFNYLLLEDIPVFTDFPDGTSTLTGCTWRINGFWSFIELEEFVLDNKTTGFSVYVRHNDYYQKTPHRFVVQPPDGEKLYVNDSEFQYPDEVFAEIIRNPRCRSFIEIIGLCEMHCNGEITTYLIDSLDDLGWELGARASEKELLWRKNAAECISHQCSKTGVIYYDDTVFTYCIEMDETSVMWNFFNHKNEPYCPCAHTFCTPASKCCQ